MIWKKILTLLAVAFSIGLFLLPAHAGDLTQRVSFSPQDLTFGRLYGFDTVSLRNCTSIGEIGQPCLPVLTAYVALPEGMEATGIEAVRLSWLEIPGTYDVLPGQPPRILSGAGDGEKGFFPGHQDSSAGIYPQEAVVLEYQSDLARVGLACVSVFPLRYLAREGRLFLHTEIEFKLSFEEGWRSPEPYRRIDERFIQIYEPLLKGMVLNPEDANLKPDPDTLGVSSSEYHHYVIITTPELEPDFQPLAEWKKKKGLNATIVTMDWIYQNYTGYSEAERVREFVVDASANWSTYWFLIGGDTGLVEPGMKNILGQDIPNDTYYSDYDSDWTCEVFVGRASVKDSVQAANYVNKVIQYETSPPMTGYAKRIGLFGFDVDSSTPLELVKEYVHQNYVPSGWTAVKVYDSHTGNHKNKMANAINGGIHIANHMDHSDFNYLGAGVGNHGWFFTTQELSAFTNGPMQNIMYSVGCWANSFDRYCCSEAFVRSTTGGAIGFVGNTRFGLYYEGDLNSGSFLFDKNFFRSLFKRDMYVLGVALVDSKNITPVGSDHVKKYCFTELNLLGDPDLTIWTEDPSVLQAGHPIFSLTGPRNFLVNVQKDGVSCSGAQVCLWKGDEVYATGTTDDNGNVEFSIDPLTGGSLYVTATCRNCVPYLGECAVGTGGDGTCMLSLAAGGFRLGDAVVFLVNAPSRPNQNVGLVVSNVPGSTYLPYYGITIPIGLQGYLIRYSSFGGNATDLNASGRIFITTYNPKDFPWRGTQAIWFAVVGKLMPAPDLVVSNTVEYTLH